MSTQDNLPAGPRPRRRRYSHRGDLPVLGFSTQAFYKWRQSPVSQRDWDDAHLVNAALDIHRDDPAFVYRFISGELSAHNRIARLCREQRVWSVYSKKRGLSRRAGPPVHDDLVTRRFTATAADQRWLKNITEHPTREGNCISARSNTCIPTESSAIRSMSA